MGDWRGLWEGRMEAFLRGREKVDWWADTAWDRGGTGLDHSGQFLREQAAPGAVQ